MPANMGSHALVIGSSVAGMLAAWVLSKHFERVTIIERDQLPDIAEFRNGVPQARHIHVLLAKGYQVFAELFPGFEADFRDMGVANIEIGWNTAGRTAGGWTKRVHSGDFTSPVRRVTVDWYLHQRLKQCDNIDFRFQTDVQAYVLSQDGRRITGVEVSSRAQHLTETISAELVVDASGRSSKTAEYLAALGYPTPQQSVVNAYLGYATRWYKLPPGQRFDWQIMLIGPIANAEPLSGGGAELVEDGRLVVTLIGANKNYPPTDEAGFMAFMQSLPSLVLYESVKDLEPDSPIYGYRRTENIWNHYERLARVPEALLVIGDAYCCFNPVYGQGMTVAAMEAQKLDALLRQRAGNLSGLSQQWFAALAQIIRNPWLLATGEDLRYPGTDGERPGFPARLVQKYIDLVVKTLPFDSDIGIAMSRVIQMQAPPGSLFHPGIMFKVLGYTLRGIQANEDLNLPLTQLQSAAGD